MMKHHLVRVALLSVLLLIAAGFAGAFPTQAAGPVHILLVNSTVDAVDANPGDGICAASDGRCTLRAAIQETNALAGGDVIQLPAGKYVLTIPGANEDQAATGDLDITGNLTINGAGARNSIIDAAHLDRVFQILNDSTVKLLNLTIQNGKVDSNSGTGGGGIFSWNAHGGMDLINVTLANNEAIFGGGIMNASGSFAWLYGITIRNNHAQYGGGIYSRDAGPVQLINSTISNNTAAQAGGGINVYYFATANLTDSTVSNNSASYGGGVSVESTSSVSGLAATIVANNSGGDCYGTYFGSKGYNLDSDNSCQLTRPTDLPGTDPLLGPLQNNGGPTDTRALLTGSPAIDHIPPRNCIVPVDQRGLKRPQGTGCDIGAVEKRVP